MGQESEHFRPKGDVWAACSHVVREQVSDSVWFGTFQYARASETPSGCIELRVPSSFVKERVEDRYLNLVRSAMADVGVDDPELVVVVDPALTQEVNDSQAIETVIDLTGDEAVLGLRPVQPPSGEPGNPAELLTGVDPTDHQQLHSLRSAGPDQPSNMAFGAAPSRADEAIKPDSFTDERYTFSAFVPGPSNRFAHAAALSVAETPGRSYNPLFIYGAAGLGKTHLLHAIGHYVRQNYADSQVRYVSTETFLNEFVESIRNNRPTEFKSRYRDIDVLLVDDIQFMEGKERMQEEFFHTFNSLHQANKQIVLCSDRPPDSISTLEDRLRSRFKMGLITDIQPPDLETRLAILRKKAEQEPMWIPDEVLEYIASNIKHNIRELEGALIRVSAFANLTRVELTIDLAAEVLGDMLAGDEPRPITPQSILEITSEMFDMPIEEIIGRSRRRPLVNIRQIAMYVTRELTDLSYPAIAAEFGGRDHTTVIHAVDKITKQMSERRQTFDQVTALMTAVRGPKDAD